MSGRAPDASAVFTRLPQAHYGRLQPDVRAAAAGHYNVAKRGALPAKMRGSYEVLAVCCLLVASQTHSATFDPADWTTCGASPTDIKAAAKELRAVLGLGAEGRTTRSGKTTSSSPVKPPSTTVTPTKRPPPAAASSASAKRPRLEPPSAAKRAAEVEEVGAAPASTPTSKRARPAVEAADLPSPQQTPTKSVSRSSRKGKGRAAADDEAIELMLPPRFVTPVGEPHDYELDPAYGAEERRAACRAWRLRTLAALRAQQV